MDNEFTYTEGTVPQSAVFADLFEKSEELALERGALVMGRVVDIADGQVLVAVGGKSESPVPIDEFRDESEEIAVEIGDEIEVELLTLEDGRGCTRVSREGARRRRSWERLEEALEQQTTVTGVLSGRTKGGFSVNIDSVRAFLPGSLVDLRPVRDTVQLERTPLQFIVIKLDRKRNNVVVSRRAAMERMSANEREQILSHISEGAVLEGVVKNLTDYGAFVDIGNIDGLLHASDMSWKRVQPSEVVQVGDRIRVRVLRFDRERLRVSLGLKQLEEDPWLHVTERYPVGSKVMTTVTNVTDYGCFAELERGVEGLVHMSEMDWVRKRVVPRELVTPGDKIEVMVMGVESQRRRISLGMKQCRENPWQTFHSKYPAGSTVEGVVRDMTDFGLFVSLEGSIDGLIYVGELSWSQSGSEAIKEYSVNQTIRAVVVSSDVDRQRISLSIRAMHENPLANWLKSHPEGSTATGVITGSNGDELEVELAKDVLGLVPMSDFRGEERSGLAPGGTVEALVLGAAKRKPAIQLSVKRLHASQERDADAAHREQILKHRRSTLGSEGFGDPD